MMNLKILFLFMFFSSLLKAQLYFPIFEGNKFGLIDSVGNIVLIPTYDYIEEDAQNYIRIVQNGKFGFLDSNLRVIIKPKFEYASQFNESKSLVYHKGKYFTINDRGEKVSNNPLIHEFQERNLELNRYIYFLNLSEPKNIFKLKENGNFEVYEIEKDEIEGDKIEKVELEKINSCVINGNFTYLNSNGKVIWQGNGLPILSQFVPRKNYKNNYPLNPIQTQKDKAQYFLEVYPDSQSIYKHKYQGMKARVFNNSPDFLYILTWNSDMRFCLQAQNIAGDWINLEYFRNPHCNMGYGSFKLPSFTSLEISVPKFNGNIKTKARLVMEYQEKNIIYSNVFDINLYQSQLLPELKNKYFDF